MKNNMTKEEYILRKNTIFDKIDKLKSDLKLLDSEYINDCREFNNGDIVLITRSTGKIEEGIVAGYEVTYQYELKPIIKKIKKDGKPSMVGISLWYNDKIEKK